MWHDIFQDPGDLPPETGDYLALCTDSTMDIRHFQADTSCFSPGKTIAYWTRDFLVPSLFCPIRPGCGRAAWRRVFGFMAYVCDRSGCRNGRG